jgi:outer membrane protein assembly factor BamB
VGPYWSVRGDAFASLGGAKASPALGDDTVVFADSNTPGMGQLFAASRADGRLLWVSEEAGGSWSAPVISEQTIVHVSKEGVLSLVELSSGRIITQHDLGEKVFASPAVVDGIIYVGDDAGTLHAITTR